MTLSSNRYKQGEQAAMEGKAPDTNPYPIGGNDYMNWFDGWADARKLIKETPPKNNDGEVFDKIPITIIKKTLSKV